MSSLMGLANILAVIAAFIGSPWLYGKSITWVQTYIAHNYGYGFDDIVALVWAIICAGLIFFTARASISTALVMGGMAIVARLI